MYQCLPYHVKKGRLISKPNAYKFDTEFKGPNALSRTEVKLQDVQGLYNFIKLIWTPALRNILILVYKLFLAR